MPLNILRAERRWAYGQSQVADRAAADLSIVQGISKVLEPVEGNEKFLGDAVTRCSGGDLVCHI